MTEQLKKLNADVDFRAEEAVIDVTEQIVAIMKRLGIDQKELARRIGRPERTVRKLLGGDREVLTLKMLAAVSIALGMKLRIEYQETDEGQMLGPGR